MRAIRGRSGEGEVIAVVGGIGVLETLGLGVEDRSVGVADVAALGGAPHAITAAMSQSRTSFMRRQWDPDWGMP